MPHLPSGFQWPPSNKALYASEVGISSTDFPERLTHDSKLYTKGGPIYPASLEPTHEKPVVLEENEVVIGYAYLDVSVEDPTIENGHVLLVFMEPFVE